MLIKPKIILDIGFLGHAYDVPAGRRGAQRVVQNLFEGLHASNACDLSFVASGHLAGTYDFLTSRNLDPSKKLAYRPSQLALSRFGRTITTKIHQTIEDRSLAARMRRRLLSEISNRCLLGESNFSSTWLDQADIYHSPHAPFPAEVREHPKIKKFLSCMDFIPLKNPEYYPSDFRPFMDAVLACLTPQNFAFCISQTTRDDVLNYSKMPPERIFVTPLAADPELFYPVTEPGLLTAMRGKYNLGDEPYFLALSALDRHKNFVHLIECFGSLVESGEMKGHNLVIVGANPARNPDAQRAIALFPRAKKQIIIPGFIPDEELATIYSGATAFLFPSLAEGFGIPPLEAMQ